MNGVRKAIGLLIIIFIGIPILIGIIWGVGLTRAVVSPEFLSEIPRDIITKIPDLVQETLEAVDREDVVHDEDARAWVRAIADAKTSPKELLENIGIMDWLKTELTQSLEEIGQILRGDLSPRPVKLNMRPLKSALKHEGIDQYIKEILEKLPPCTDTQTMEWVEAVVKEKPFEYDTPPACQPPDLAEAVKTLRQSWIDEVDEIPDEVDMIESDEWDFYPHKGVNINRIVVSFTYLLFFIPAVILLLAALLASPSGPGILRWTGISTLIGGLVAFGLSKFIGKIVQWGIGFGPIGYSYSEVDIPFEQIGEIFVEKMGDIILLLINHLFSAVNTVAGAVCIVGIVLIALSYLVTRDNGGRPNRTSQASPPGAGNTNTPGTPGTSPTSPPTGSGGDSVENENQNGTQKALGSSPQPPALQGREGDKALNAPPDS